VPSVTFKKNSAASTSYRERMSLARRCVSERTALSGTAGGSGACDWPRILLRPSLNGVGAQ